jgi:Flp pilus assembly pilin Flp
MSTLRQLLNERAVTANEYGVIGVAAAAVVVAVSPALAAI